MPHELTGCCACTFLQEGNKAGAAGARQSSKKAKGTKLPVSALGEGLSGKDGAGRGSYASVGRGARSGGRGSGGGSAPGSSRRGTADQEGVWSKKEGVAGQAHANGHSAAAADGYRQGAEGRGISGRGGRGGRSRHSTSAFGRSITTPVAGPMMTPFMPATGPAGPPIYYNANAYNVFYPSTAFFPVAAAPGGSTAKQAIMESVKKQIEYYFSTENLSKDVFLRSKVSTGSRGRQGGLHGAGAALG